MKLVTGATGFIGAHLLYYLISNGDKVTALKRPSSNLDYVKKVFSYYTPNDEEIFREINWIDGDVLDYEGLLEISKGKSEIVHSAAMVSFDSRDKYKMLETNVQGTANVVNAALEAGIRNLGYISSVAALDPPRGNQVITEEFFGNFPQRYSSYAESKFNSELEIWRGIEEGLNVVVINPSVVLGPYLPMEGPGSLFKLIKRGIDYYPSGLTGFVDVRDVCKILLTLMQKQIVNERFIVSEGNHSYKDLFQMAAEYFQTKIPQKELKPFITGLAWKLDKIRTTLFMQKPLITRDLHQSAHRKVRFSNEKIINTLGHQFIPFKKSIEDTLATLNL